MKFLAKNITFLFVLVVILPLLVLLYLHFAPNYYLVTDFLGWSYMFTFFILTLISFIGAVFIVTVNFITKKNSPLLYLGCCLTLIPIAYLLFALLAFRNATYSL
jgi:hypothetical protein